jgi:hypothetical protein
MRNYVCVLDIYMYYEINAHFRKMMIIDNMYKSNIFLTLLVALTYLFYFYKLILMRLFMAPVF